MSKLYSILIILITLVYTSNAQSVATISYNDLEERLSPTSDTLYMVNFWATWCVPCVKEVPAIEKVREKHQLQKLKILMVSLDFPNQIDTRLIPFIEKHNLKSEVVLLNAPDFNAWINNIDSSWSGAIPATLIFRKEEKYFYEKSFEFFELDSIITSKL